MAVWPPLVNSWGSRGVILSDARCRGKNSPLEAVFFGAIFLEEKTPKCWMISQEFWWPQFVSSFPCLVLFSDWFPNPQATQLWCFPKSPKEPLRTVPGPQLWRAAAVPVAAASKLRGLGACQWQRLPGAAAGGSEDVWRTGGTDLVAAELNPCWVDVFSPNSASTLRGSYCRCKGLCLIRVLTLVCGLLPVNFRIKWLLWNVEVHFDGAGSHKMWSAGLVCGILL